ncbi:hypothetical protein FLK61_39190 [Paenalkalicoccus suaedae]|uniref:Uncharacterized protein n=1 Tax=Paenalkalicoccus suaedae TaxID=2592382 RepID=A0A859FIT8_9BACI|nr:hypothetical protein [Paenalkalicoccus suaedae]QKS72642.1 hypothetical protein FLK61_39190 [Paenalkalicoccus suaedae]
MKPAKIHPLILISLLISAISMGQFAYRNVASEQFGYAIFFIVMTGLLIGMIIFGLVVNRGISKVDVE